jgi:serine/threonine protein kinase/tetratricopeptide (TPR) repeat protein
VGLRQALAATGAFELVEASSCAQHPPSRWQLLKAIVTEALEESSPARRVAIVSERCGEDKDLRREVEMLLNQTTSAFEEFAQNGPQEFERQLSILVPGLRLGAYEVLRELGRGGMGAVYLARRADGAFKKEVAIKVLKRGTDTDEVLRRFQAERDILARLIHPNIARLLDAGTTDDGLPYFVMDYVDGKPITAYANERKLSIRERLSLFRVVCSAVGYAHQNLVIHRDLKPGNVLVTEQGEVMLLDFGIAKLLDEANPHVTVTTQRRLTPLYASPEQVRGEPVTTVSDVYSLGVFLYELVTGDTPYKVEGRTPDEITRAICEQQPQKPSTTAARRAGNSKLEIRHAKILSGDIDNIVLKALRKEPSRRYPSVDQFSEDVRRHLEGMPVHARKDTVVYRAGKFIGRHKVGVAVATLTALALVAATIITTWQAREARREKRLAERRFDQVRKLAHSVLFEYHDQIAILPGSTKVREKLVDDSLAYLDELAKEAGGNRALLREIAAAYERVGAVQGGVSGSLQAPLPSSSNLGDAKSARESFRKALGIRETLARSDPHNHDAQLDLLNCYTALAALEIISGDPQKGIDYDFKAARIIDNELRSDPANEKLQTALAGIYIGIAKAYGVPGLNNLGNVPSAVSYSQKTQAIVEKLAREHPDNRFYSFFLGSVHNTLSFLAQLRGDIDDEIAECLKAAEIDRRLVAAEPNNTVYRRELAVQLGNAGTAMLRRDDRAGARPKMQEALALYETLAAADPNDMSLQRNLAVGHRNVAAASETTDRETALRHFHTALDILSRLVTKDPTNTDFQRLLAICYLYQARYLTRVKELDAAVRSDEQGIKIEEALVASAPQNAGAKNTLAQLYADVGKTEEAAASSSSKKELWTEARASYQRSLALYEDMKTKGTLAPTDAKKPEELSVEIAKCDAAVK